MRGVQQMRKLYEKNKPTLLPASSATWACPLAKREYGGVAQTERATRLLIRMLSVRD